MKKLILIISLAMLSSCVDVTKRMEFLKNKFPNSKVEPATGLIQQQGYEFIIIDSTNQILAVDFYCFSETKIRSLRNIR